MVKSNFTPEQRADIAQKIYLILRTKIQHIAKLKRQRFLIMLILFYVIIKIKKKFINKKFLLKI